MEFRLRDRVLRPLNVSIKPGEYIHLEEVVKINGKNVNVKHAVCAFRGVEFLAPANTTVFQRALIVRPTIMSEAEYAVIWYINNAHVQVSLNRVNPFFSPGMPGDQVFLTVKDEREFRELEAFVIEQQLDRIGVGDEIPYETAQDPMGFHRVKT